MKTLAALALAALAGCTSSSSPTRTEIDTQYEYGTFAGLSQRPAPDSY